MLILGDDECVDETWEVSVVEVKEGEDEEVLECNSLGIFSGFERQNTKALRTIRIKGTIKGIPVEVLIDTGASHCFVSPQVATTLELAGEPCKKLRVRLGDGHRAMTQEECRDVEILFGKFRTIVNPYILELGDLDVILGVSWLQKLGKVTFDWVERMISFQSEGETIILNEGRRIRLEKQGVKEVCLQYHSKAYYEPQKG